jgi:hypothetical protein
MRSLSVGERRADDKRTSEFVALIAIESLSEAYRAKSLFLSVLKHAPGGGLG